MRRTACLLVVVALLGCTRSPEPADLVVRGGRIVTLDPTRPEARALASRGGRIVAVGSEEEVAPYVGSATHVLELGDAVAYPGFIEAHGHFTGLGRALGTLDLRSARSWEEVVDRAKTAAEGRPKGAWIYGWGWHQEKWDAAPVPSVEGYPVHDALSAAVPDHPVLLKHAAGEHLGVVNAKGLAAAGIDDATPDPPGGTILRDARRHATGVLREEAYRLADHALRDALAKRTPAEVEREAREEIARAARACVANGVTSFQDAGSSFATLDLLRRVAEEGGLSVRLWVMAEGPNDVLRRRLAEYRWVGLADGRLTVGGIKRYVDGALGSHGAWLLEPYADLPKTSGLEVAPLVETEETARLALEHHLQLAVHAIGDRGNREILNLYERVLSGRSGSSPRFRIEHVQHLHPDDVPRFARLGVIASMQPVHCVSDGPWVPTRLGETRARDGAYLWRSLLDAGTVVVSGTDTPVEEIDPIANFHAAVTRRMKDGRAFHPGQQMTREEALRSMTSAAAFAAFEEELKGTLTPGRYADLTVVSQDLLTVPDDRIRETRVVHTIVGGKVLR